MLGLPAFGLSLSITTVSALLPVLVAEQAGPLVAGAMIAAEGVFALAVPGLVGPLVDRPRRRLPALAIAAVFGAGALVAFAFDTTLAVLAVCLALFQVAYFAYLTPFLAIFPDVVDDEHRGRSQGFMGVWRELGLALALVGGPVLLGLWRPAPFLIAAAVLLVVTPVLWLAVAGRMLAAERNWRKRPRGGVLALLREHADLRRFFVANALWEGALATLRAFAVLFITAGLDRSEGFASLALGVVVLAALVAAPAAGWLADRYGRGQVVRVALCAYAAGLGIPALSQSPLVFPVVFVGALAAVTVMTLPFGLLMDLLPAERHGTAAALFGTSRGLGLLAGPLAGGLAVVTLDGVFAGTDGYAAIFVVAALFIVASLPVAWTIGR